MAVVAERHANFALFQVTVLEGQGAGGMVGGDHHQSVSVGGGPFEHVAQGAVKVQQLFHRLFDIVGVQPVVYARSLNHHCKALVASRSGERFDTARHHFTEEVSPLLGYRQVIVGHQRQDRQLRSHQFFFVRSVVVAPGLHFGNDVAAILALGAEVVAAATGNEVHAALCIVCNDGIIMIATFVVAAEIAGCGIRHVASDHYTRLLAKLLRLVQHRV